MSKGITTPVASFLHEQQLFSIFMLRLVGYGLIAMASIDFISLVVPPKLMNPTWEFQTMGAMVERLPIVLLGMVFIFYGEREARKAIEHKLLKCFSWLTLVMAISLFLSFPLSIVNGFRIYYSSNARVNAQIAPRIDLLTEFQAELQSAQSVAEISNVLQQQSNKPITIPQNVNKKDLKSNILEEIKTNQQQLESQIKKIRSEKRFTLLKNGVKWNLGALISAFLLVFIWQQTKWARMPYEIE